MSLDARYILNYEVQLYIPPTPMELDKEFLRKEFGGDFIELHYGYDIYWDKPKYTLLPEDIKKLRADQILELQDGGIWKDVTPKGRNARGL